METEDKAEHSDPEKDEDVGITFIARKAETPKQRPKSGKTSVSLKNSVDLRLDVRDRCSPILSCVRESGCSK